MFSDKSQLVAAYAELCVALTVLQGVRSKRKIMEAIDPKIRKKLLDVFDTLYDWQEELTKEIRGL